MPDEKRQASSSTTVGGKASTLVVTDKTKPYFGNSVWGLCGCPRNTSLGVTHQPGCVGYVRPWKRSVARGVAFGLALSALLVVLWRGDRGDWYPLRYALTLAAVFALGWLEVWVLNHWDDR